MTMSLPTPLRSPTSPNGIKVAELDGDSDPMNCVADLRQHLHWCKDQLAIVKQATPTPTGVPG